MMILEAVTLLGFPFVLSLPKVSQHRGVQFLGPIMIVYILGAILGNWGWLGGPISKEFSEITIVLAIPALLFSANIKDLLKNSRTLLISFFLAILSIVVASFLGATFFHQSILEAPKISGMLVGVYTGGTPNMSAIGLALGVESETFLLLNTADMIFSSLYLLFLLTLAPKILGYFLPTSKEQGESFQEERDLKKISWQLKYYFISLGLILLILGVTFGLNQLLFEKIAVPFFILSITSGGILVSLLPKIKGRPEPSALGHYFLLVFSFSIGSLANLESMIQSGGEVLLFVGFVMLMSILIHYLLAKIFKMDRDLTLVTSVAGIFGPAFIAMITDKLKNPRLLLPGMTMGLLGYAVGNYLGIGLFYLLKSWF